ncbi:sugar phosphate isomerase/epimerase [Candidatus Woesearchaeota archaeon]|nr:sugar phosphate isomerase/epimerase [Candidatus Woesearchaeota archaeon]
MANQISGDYYHTMDQDYGTKAKEFQKDIGVTVFEGAEGRFHQSVQAKIRHGVGAIELQVGGQGENFGAESYGKEAREELKKLAELNEVDIHSVHSPAGVIGFSGFDPQRGQFSEEQRDFAFNEVIKTIDFAADVTHGGSLVIHTGEFNRPMVSGFKEFEAYEGEEYAADVYFADKDSGKVEKLSRDISIPVALKKPVLDKEGKPVYDEFGRRKMETVWEGGKPKMTTKNWFDYNEELQSLKKQKSGTEAEKEFREKYSIPKGWSGRDLAGAAFMHEYFNNQLDSEVAQYHRWAEAQVNAERNISMMRKKLEMQKAREQRFRDAGQQDKLSEEYIEHPVTKEMILKSEYEQEELEKATGELRYHKEMAESHIRNIEQIKKRKNDLAPIKEVALKRTADSLAKMGVIAWEKTKEKKLDRPITLTPENLSPVQFGSHPEEMVEIVEASRKAMVERMTKAKIPDPSGRQDYNKKTGKWEVRMIPNPYFKEEFSGEQGRARAKELAKKHIKATLDFQHMQMWNKHFKRKPGETEPEREKRFNKWFEHQVGYLADKGVIGNVHVVDGYGRGHVHLPAGQGKAPVERALEILRDKGIKAPFTSEGWFEGPARQSETAFEFSGKHLYTPTGSYNFAKDVMGRQYSMYAPTYLFGDLAPDRDDFTVWSEVPLE